MEWFDIKGYKGFYQVSPFGEVRNARTKRVLKPLLYKNGYHVVRLRKNGEVKQMLVHRLVATTLIENKNPKLTVVRHIDGNKLNNQVNNLEWTSIGRNVSKSWGMGLNDCKGSKNGRAVVNEEDVRNIRKLYSEGYTIKDLLGMYEIKRTTMSHIVNYDTWKHID